MNTLQTNLLGFFLVLIVVGLMALEGYCLGKFIEGFGKEILGIDTSKKEEK